MPTISWPFQDVILSAEQRAADLLTRLPVADKVGLLFHPHGGICDPDTAYEPGRVPLARQIRDLRISHFALQGSTQDSRSLAEFTNRLQQLALDASPFSIPVTVSTDPRHSAAHNLLTSNAAGAFSEWPEPLGFGAIASTEAITEYADVVRREYLATGIRAALHPQVDLVTEPRWARSQGSFSEDADLTATLAAAYIRGLQGEQLGPESVAAMTKHFPGGGPQRDGLDPHFADGREQVYPGGQQRYHLRPFVAAIEAGTAQIMPYYGMPVGTGWDEVGFAFSKAIITDLLRTELGFEGVVCTDWTLIRDISPEFPAKAWGVEQLSEHDRALMLLEAGVDQFGGENCVEVVLDLLHQGRVSQARIDESAHRILKDKFRLGLFDDQRFVDPDRANAIVGCPAHRQAGFVAQQQSMVLLRNDAPASNDAAQLLPLRPGLRVYAEGIDPKAFDGWATSVADPAQADVAIVRMASPNYADPRRGWLGSLHQGSLDFTQDQLDHIATLAAILPTVVDVHLSRPAVLTGLSPATALLASFGTCDEAFVEVLFGRAHPEGNLPFDLPSSMEAVENSREDVAFDTADPLFRFGHGLRYRAHEVPGVEDELGLVPQPQEVHPRSGPSFQVSGELSTEASEDDLLVAARLLEPGTGLRVGRAVADPQLRITRADGSAGSYTLEVDASRISITAGDRDGVIAALTTLRQLMPDWVHGPAALPGQVVSIPQVAITDRPRHGWRGMHLDVARHHMPLPFLYRYVDLLAQHKFNRFHLHLNDDQGWRFEVKALPNLTAVGAGRTGTQFNNWSESDGTPHGGFYTQDQLRALVGYAAARGVVVVPEIDVPGHARALLASYPEFGDPEAVAQPVATSFGVFEEVVHLSEQAVVAIDTIFDELMDVFDSPWIHIGGDECPTTQWTASQAAAQRAQDLGLEGPEQLQAWLTRHLVELCHHRGRQVIGWDEVLDQAGLPEEVIVMSWQGAEPGRRALAQGHRVIMAPSDHYYFDFYASSSAEEPYSIGGHIRWQDVIAFDPTGDEDDELLLGVQGQLWTEYITDPQSVEYHAFPRACALAEVAWRGPCEPDQFEPRLVRHLRRLQALGVNYRPLEGPLAWQQGGTGRYSRPEGHQ